MAPINVPQNTSTTKARPPDGVKHALNEASDVDQLSISGRSLEHFQLFILSVTIPITLFGSSNFGIIVGQMTDPKDISDPPILSLATVRTLLALAWLSFVLVFGLSAVSLGLLAAYGGGAQMRLTASAMRKLTKLTPVVVILICCFIALGFMFMMVALVAYVQVVAFVAIGGTAVAGILVVAAGLYVRLSHLG